MSKNPDIKKLAGFSIHQKGKSNYAVKHIAGKVHWILLGENLEGAETKISAYCQERGIEPDSKKSLQLQTDTVRKLETAIAALTLRLEKLETKLAEALTAMPSQKARVRRSLETTTTPTQADTISQGDKIKVGDFILGFEIKAYKENKECDMVLRAYKRIAGKPKAVYLCREQNPITSDQASAKIQAYLAKISSKPTPGEESGSPSLTLPIGQISYVH